MKPSHTPMPKNIAICKGPKRRGRSSACWIASLTLVSSSTSASRIAPVMIRATSRLGTISISRAPTMAPIDVGMLTLMASPQGTAFLVWNFQVAEIEPSSSGTRLVALAVMGSSPIAISTGSDTAEPDDATVLRKPQATPAAMASARLHHSYPNTRTLPRSMHPPWGRLRSMSRGEPDRPEDVVPGELNQLGRDGEHEQHEDVALGVGGERQPRAHHAAGDAAHAQDAAQDPVDVAVGREHQHGDQRDRHEGRRPDGIGARQVEARHQGEDQE